MTSSIDSVLVAAGVSAGVTIVALLLKQYFDHRTERFKLSHASRAKVEDSLLPRRLELYPRLVELIYRSRNMARDIAAQSPSFAPSLLEEFKSKGKEYEDCLYKGRLDLERDHVFKPTHHYKQMLLDFSRCFLDVGYACSQNDGEHVEANTKRLREIYGEIDEAHVHLISQLSSSALLQDSINNDN